jgi:hypothetical protein
LFETRLDHGRLWAKNTMGFAWKIKGERWRFHQLLAGRLNGGGGR